MCNIEKIIAVSTCNAPCENPDFGRLRTCEHKYGWVVFVSAGLKPPAWLEYIYSIAVKESCTLILFDRDALCLDGAKVYEW